MVNMVLGVLAVIVLTAVTGYFVAQEFTFVTADRLALQQQAARGDRRAAHAIRVMERLSFMLSGAQLGITVTTLVVGFIARPALAEVLAPLIGAAGLPAPAVNGVALGTGFIVATIIQMVLGELVPKNLALAEPEPLARALASSTLVYLALAGPIIRLFDTTAGRVLRVVGIEPVEELRHGATLEELGHIIGESQDHLAAGHADLLGRALMFSDRTADEVMVPRVDVVTVSAHVCADSLSEVMAAHGHSNYPVVGESVDDLVGVVGLRELVSLDPREAPRTRVRQIARPALMVPSSLALPDVVSHMQVGGEKIACVVDEYGGFAGLVTWEDVAEELVGEIFDETDTGVLAPATRRAGWWFTDAILRVDEVSELTGIALPEGDYDTVAGLLLERLGRVAEPGDAVSVELPPIGPDGSTRRAEIEVLTVDRHVPERIRMRAVEVTAGNAVAGGGTGNGCDGEAGETR